MGRLYSPRRASPIRGRRQTTLYAPGRSIAGPTSGRAAEDDLRRVVQLKHLLDLALAFTVDRFGSVVREGYESTAQALPVTSTSSRRTSPTGPSGPRRISHSDPWASTPMAPACGPT